MLGSTPVDNYCERLGPGLWAEPLNATTNLAFILGAWLVWRLARERGALTGKAWLLIALMATVGAGSGLFHTVATTLTEWLDIIPILVFQLAFLWLYFRDVIGLRRMYAGAILVVFLGAALAGETVQEVLNGSLTYAPALITLAILGIYHYMKNLEERTVILIASGVFLLSLTFRTIDGVICSHLPIGTHFLWHILNAVLLYLVARAYVLNQSSAQPLGR
jgi:hypothetical protein